MHEVTENPTRDLHKEVHSPAALNTLNNTWYDKTMQKQLHSGPYKMNCNGIILT